MSTAVRRHRPAADRRDRARGERGHRQDVHDRRAGGALRGRRASPLEQLLLVTFTRMATGELRDRVRERLVSAEQGLARALAGAPPDRDEVVRLLCDGPPRGGRAAPPPARARAGRLRQRDDRDHPRLLPGGARRARRGRRRRAGRDVRGGHRRPRRGGRRRPLPAPLPLGRRPAGLRPRAGAADRPRRDRQPGDADRAARGRRRTTVAGDAPRARRGGPQGARRAASAGSR